MTDEGLKDLARKIAQLDEMQKAKLEVTLKEASSGIKIKTKGENLSGSTVGEDGKLTEEIQKTGLGESGIFVEERTTIRTYDCGHPSLGVGNFGGKCQIRGCNRTFCNKFSVNNPLCYGRCIVCHRMLCMKHAHAYDSSGEIFCGPICYIKKRLGLVR